MALKPPLPGGETPASPALSLFTIAGIEVRLDPSVIIIFTLIVYSLGSGLFPLWHPDWPPLLIWGTATLAGVLFFASLLAHELSHSFVAQKYGIAVPRITLFLFGGMAETSREPDTPRSEFFIAIAGPLMSMFISIVCSMIVVSMIGDDAMAERIADADEAALATLGPIATTLLWLGSINMILALFNLIPGFPMDGGRVFRAVIWGSSGNKLKATRWATNVGKLFGWSLMILGVMGILGGELAGLWWILIGWFISHLAQISYSQLVMQQALKGFQIHELMNTRFDSIDANLNLQDFIDNYLLRSRQQLWPVSDTGRLIGFVSLDDVVDVDSARRSELSVGDILQSSNTIRALDADSSARQALESLAAGAGPVPVMRGNQLVGFIQPGDLVRWLSLHDPDLR